MSQSPARPLQNPPNRNLWKRIRLLFSVLNLTRFSFILGLAATLAAFTDQGQEVLIAMGETGWSLVESLRKTVFVLSTCVCAFTAWYTARIMYLFHFRIPASNSNCFPRVKAHLPRWLGAAVLIFAAIALPLAESKNIWLALILLLACLFFLIFVYYRRDWFKLDKLADAEKDFSSLGALPKLTRKILLIMLIMNPVLMAVFIFFHLRLAPAIGLLSVVFIALSALIVSGSALVYLGNRYQAPVIGGLIVIAIVFSFCNDNHAVRKKIEVDDVPISQNSGDDSAQPGKPAQTPTQYSDLGDYFKAWSQDLAEKHPQKPTPIFFVAAEGGGIRAAYWTAIVLAALQDKAASMGLDFARHVFAVSGVSGGSLGAAVFAALSNTPYPPDKSNPAESCNNQNNDIYRCRVQKILSQDFLSPTIAVMLFPDLLQRFIPFPIFDDRAEALERSWELAWNRFETGQLFSHGFLDLWLADPFKTPLLFLNSTVVETGQRIIVNPVRFGPERFEKTFHEALDALPVIGSEIPLSTAVHMSARFTYVSPAGTIEAKGQKILNWIRVVDGGYFENSGAVTLDEIIYAVMAEVDRSNISIRPIAITISNDPIEKSEDEAEKYPGKHTLMGELLSPVRALLHTRPARGFQARSLLAERVAQMNTNGGVHIHFALCRYEVTLPLGWMLSDLAQEDMRHQLLGYPKEASEASIPGAECNSYNLDRVVSLLADKNDPGEKKHRCW